MLIMGSVHSLSQPSAFSTFSVPSPENSFLGGYSLKAKSKPLPQPGFFLASPHSAHCSYPFLLGTVSYNSRLIPSAGSFSAPFCPLIQDSELY